jgi:hypothetical protein
MRTFLFLPGALVLCTLGVSPVFAQAPPRPERPYRGLFGGGTTNADQTLIFSAEVGTGYSDTIQLGPTTSEVLQDPSALSGSFQLIDLALSYSLSRKRFSFFATGASAMANYSARTQGLVQSQGGTIGANYQFTKKTALSFNENISYAPYLFSTSIFGLPNQLGTQVAPVDLDAGAGLERVLTTNTNISLSQALTRRMNLSFNYAGNRTRSDSGTRDFSADSAGGHLSIALSKGLALRLGYGYTGGTDGNGQRFYNRVIDAGLDFNRALSLSRRMTLSFSTGFAAITYASQTEYTALGHITLDREIGRSWTASVSYRRDLSMSSTLREPVLYDSAMFALRGLLGRRLAFDSSVGVSLGDVGASQTNNNFHNYYALIGLTYGMTRLIGLGVDYLYYHYLFDGGVILPTGLAEWADRQTILVSAKLWFPLLERARKVNVTR